MAIGTLAAVQMGLGAVGAIKNMLTPEKKRSITSGTANLVSETRQRANITQGAGMAQAKAEARQTQADTIGLLERQTDDPNKLAAIAGQTNLQGLKAGQQRDATTQQQRLQGQQQYAQALGQLAGEERRVQDDEVRREDKREATASNLLGAGAQNIMNTNRDDKMLGAYGKINDVDMSEFMSGNEKIFGQGSGWIKRLFGGSVNIGMNKVS